MLSTRIGLIGCGQIGTLRAAALAGLDRLQLAVVSDLDRSRAAELARQFDTAHESDWSALLQRSDIDAVIVSTPPSSHAEICMQALAAGKHVLCEKPLARTSEECRPMLEAAHTAGRVLATGFNFRYFPSVAKARVLLDSGVIGELDHLRGYTGYSAAEHGHEWIHDRQTVGGGALWDNGIHMIDLAAHFMGEIVEAKGFSTDGVWRFDGCEDNGFVMLRSRAGVVANLQASWTEWRGYRFQLELYGSRGCVRVRCFPMLTELIWSDTTGGRTNRKVHYFPYRNVMERVRSYRWTIIQSFVDELRDFSQAVEGAHTNLGSAYDGYRAVSVAQAASNHDQSGDLMAELT